MRWCGRLTRRGCCRTNTRCGRDPDRGGRQPQGLSSKEGPPPAADDDLGNPSVDFRGERRRNETHASTTDPEARLLRKGQGKEARLTFLGHALKGIATAC